MDVRTHGAVGGLNMKVICLTPGAIAFSISSHFPMMGKSKEVKPVMLPPGRARLETRPCPFAIWIARPGRALASRSIGPCAASTTMSTPM